MHNGFSGSSPYDDTFYALYEVTCTSLAILLYFIFDQQVDMRFTGKEEGLGYKLSHFYKHCRENIIGKTTYHYWAWLLMSFLGAIAIFYIPNKAYSTGTSVDASGKTDGLYAANYVAVTIMVVVHHGIMVLGARHLSWWLIMWYVISFLLFFPVTVFLNNVVLSSGIFLSTFQFVMQSATYWLSTVLCSSTMLLIYYLVHFLWY